MGRSTRVIAILIVSVAITTGAVLASTGVRQFRVFDPDTGSLNQRLAAVEDFLESNSRQVKAETERVRRQVNDLTAIIHPATCPTTQEQAYLDGLLADLDALEEAFTAMREHQSTNALERLAATMATRTPAPTLRGQLLHADVRRSALSLAPLVPALEAAIEADNADVVVFAAVLSSAWMVNTLLLVESLEGYCPSPPQTPTRATTIRTPTAQAVPPLETNDRTR